MINGLDLFSGIGGLTLALSEWVKPVAYCEIDKHARAVLLSRMSEEKLPSAPIWDDITTLSGSMLPSVEIIYGGFPCQDISVAGAGAGLEGKRSSLFFEIHRLVGEMRPAFIFLENVPAIRSRGGEQVCKSLAGLGYDLRWDTLSAQEIGAPHIRNRWWLLATDAKRVDLWDEPKREPERRPRTMRWKGKAEPFHNGPKKSMAESADSETLHGSPIIGSEPKRDHEPIEAVADHDSERGSEGKSRAEILRWHSDPFQRSWWELEPDVGRVANGISFRVDRLKGLGNSVVPAQAREAFMRLGGLK